MSDSPIQAVLSALDALDLDAALALFSPRATLLTVYGNEAVGRDSVQLELEAFVGELRATKHELSSVWNPEPGVWIAELSATYELDDFSRLGPYRRVVVLRTGDEGIESLRLYGAHELPLALPGRPYGEVRGPRGWLPTL